MYTEFFGLTEKPFTITPNPRYLYLSQRHADALAHLIYGISESGGFIQLTGEVGTGKTTLIRSLLEQLPEKAEIALILNPQLTTGEFFAAICEELRLEPPDGDTVKATVDRLNAYLLQAHSQDRRVVLIVDEAQTLGTGLLEQVRLLTNLETAKQKLLQIILIGQPELRDVLARREMRQIAQRVTGRYHLEPLSREDTAAYVRHRMRVAGSHGEVFLPAALKEIYRRSNGVPRLINVIADRALLAAYTRDTSQVDGKLVRMAAAEVFGQSPRGKKIWWTATGAIAAAAAGLAVAGMYLDVGQRLPPAALPAAERPAAPADTPARDREDARTPAAASLPERETEPAAAEDAPLATLAGLLSDPSLRLDTGSAIGALFELWNAEYDAEGAAPCEQAAAQGLRCHFQDQGSISQLRRLDRPSILSLTDQHGASRQVVVSGLGQDYAELAINGRPVEVDLLELTHYWHGDHLLLWRPALPQPKNLSPGMRDEDVLWLRESLARIDGISVTGEPSPVYDAGLEERVRGYQRERRLTVDGIVGTNTQIALATDLDGPDAPRLSKHKDN